ncbi:MAG: mechanosensitive ion channel domain-containing protein [Cyanobacteria bacterium P01_H01_bin.15]
MGRWFKSWCVKMGLVLVGLLLLAGSTFAQVSDTAPIQVDGQTIFRVGQTERYSAQERAKLVNNLIQRKVNRGEFAALVTVDERSSVPVIYWGDDYLLSVTVRDTETGQSPEQQAQRWSRELTQAITKANNERRPRFWLRSAALTLLYMSFACLCSWVLRRLWRIRLQQKKQAQSQGTNAISHRVTLGLRFFFFLGNIGIWYAMISASFDLLPQTRTLHREIQRRIWGSLTADNLSLGTRAFSLIDLLFLAIAFVGLVFLARLLKQTMRSRVLSLTGLSLAAQESIALTSSYIFAVLGSIVLLQVWGLDVSSLTVFAGVLGVGFGLGIQDIAKEVVSGLVLIFDRPVQVGDFVEVGELSGTIAKISVRSTEIRTLDQISIILPNSHFLDREIINWSHNSPVSRLGLPISVAYGSQVNLVKSTLVEVGQEHPDILSNPLPRVYFKGFGDSALDFRLLVWIADPRRQEQIKSDLYFRIDQKFRDRKIEIPFPQRDLHIRSGSAELAPQLIQALTDVSHSLAQWLNQQNLNQ